MSETIQQISADLAQRLGAWLEQPDDASAGLQELRERLGALRGTLGASATSGALRELSGAEKSIKATRQREAADAIAAACRELGIRLEPGAPLKRVRKRAAKPASSPALAAAEPAAGEGGTASTTAATDGGSRERSGLLSRLGTAQ